MRDIAWIGCGSLGTRPRSGPRPFGSALVRLLGAGLLAAAQLACEDDTARPETAAGLAAHAYFPLVEGAVWTYSLTGLSSVPLDVEVVGRGLREVRGLEGSVFVMDERTTGPASGFAELAPVGYVRVGDYVGRFLGLDYDATEIRRLAGEEPVRFVPVNPPADADAVLEWSDESKLFQLPEQEGGMRFWRHRASRVAELTVPAGTFRDVLRVESRYFEELEGSEPVLRFEDFYAAGVGLLRTVTYDEQQGGRIAVEQLLLGYRFPESSRPPPPPTAGP